MRRIKLFFRKHVVTRVLYLRAYLLFLSHRHAEASDILDRGVILAPASYPMHWLLGRCHLARERELAALQEFSICYHLDPARFASGSMSAALQEEVLLHVQVPDDQELDEVMFREGDPLPEEWDDLLDEGLELETELLAGSDFSSMAEYRRLQDLPPLTEEEIKATDLDLLLEQVSASSTHGETLDQG